MSQNPKATGIATGIVQTEVAFDPCRCFGLRSRLRVEAHLLGIGHHLRDRREVRPGELPEPQPWSLEDDRHGLDCRESWSISSGRRLPWAPQGRGANV
jgi:hypothetical protein